MTVLTFHPWGLESVIVGAIRTVTGSAYSTVTRMVLGIVAVVSLVAKGTPIGAIDDPIELCTPVVMVFILDQLNDKGQVPFTPKVHEEGVMSDNDFQLVRRVQTIEVVLKFL